MESPARKGGSLNEVAAMGSLLHFSNRQLYMVEKVMDLAQDLVTGHFNLSSDEWKNCRYEVKTLAHLSQAEIADKAFAQICKYECVKENDPLSRFSFDLYRICLQDNWILNAVNRSLNKIGLRPLLTYIITHELSHVVRFSKYCKNFFALPEEKEMEEATVHSITYEMLRSIGDRDIDRVLYHYRGCRWDLSRS